jgi:asparagine synthase (glutamine-hydrolysing)
MCGITGRFNFRTGAPVDSEILGRMCDLIRHRGPDGQYVWTSGDLGLGHRRLAVIDLSHEADQPFHSTDGRFTIVFNGEIYNFQDLRQDLQARGYQFRTKSDTEVIIEAYREYGLGALSRLRGMFAFAIWDSARRILFAARDCAGKKPFYYRLDADGFAFASEPKAFHAEPGFVAEADPDALYHYLSHQFVPSPSSAFRGLARLPAGHFLVADERGVRTGRYWSLKYSPKHAWTDAQAEEEVLDRLRKATRLRMISDVPLGAFLSGGVDSSLIVALMAEAGSGPVKTFSIGFREFSYDELPYARIVAKRFGTEHHEAVVRPDAVSVLPKLVWHYNEPFADSSAVPSFYLAEMTRRHVTVALNGDGGDENFAGYERYLAGVLAQRIALVPAPVRRSVARAVQAVPVGATRSTRARIVRFLSAAGDTAELRYARWMFHFSDEQKRKLCTPDFLARVGDRETSRQLAATFIGADGEGLLDALLRSDVGSYLVDDLLVKMDIATMAFGLEGRSPLLDRDVMECAARLPERFKLRGREKKYLLRRIARRFLPAEVIDRPKMGFAVPIDRWFRNELKEMANDLLLGASLRQRGYFNMPFIERILKEHQTGVRNWHPQLWNLLMFELWHQAFIDGSPRVR